MKNKDKLKKIISMMVITIVMALSFFTPLKNIAAIASKDDVTSDRLYIDFDTRLKFYLDMKTKKFLKKMSLKEKLLAQMIQNITDEIQARGKEAFAEGTIGFDLIYGKDENIIQEYNAEINSIKNIINELDKLELLVQRKDDLKLIQEVELVKDQLMRALDEHKMGETQLSNQEIAKMIHDYSKEIDRILKIFEEIETFQNKARAMGDKEIVSHLDRQKERVIKILEESRIAGTVPDKIVQDYIKEATGIVQVLKEIDALKNQASSDSVELTIDQVREQIVANIDNRILELFGFNKEDDFGKVTISEYFKNWKAEKIAEYQVRYTKYRIFRDNLIRTAKPNERNRMLEADISNALLNYSDEYFELAEMQFRQILSAYGDYYPNLEGVVFYQSEANFANHYFDAAREGYLKIVNEYPNSPYVGQSYLRLMMISYTYNMTDEFLKYYEKIHEFTNLDKEDVNKANYLAAHRLAQRQRYQDAEKALGKISPDSKYYLVAQYLHGTVLINLDDYNQAIKIFENIVSQKNYPWTDLNVSIIINETLLKLGFLEYQRGEYERAIAYFDQISKGYDRYDSGLLGQAWANLKTGQYDTVINKVDLLCNNYLMSNYTYEALVLSAHCKRIQNRTPEAINDLRYVANAKHVLKKVTEYNKERRRILSQLDELELLEEKILDHQNKRLYPKVVQIRDLISDALASFRFRGAISSRMLDEYNNERKILIRQIEEFERIITFAEKEGDDKLLENAYKQRDRLVTVLKKYQFKQPVSNVSYFLDYPLATKEGGIIYRRDIINNLVRELLMEKESIQKDLQIVTELASLRDKSSSIDVTVDLEILEEDLRDLNNRLNQFQVWLASHRVEEINTETVHWANFSGFGISDINFTLFREQDKKIQSFSKNITEIESLLKKKKQELEKRLTRFDSEMRKIQKEMEAEKIRLEKLEKEKYFQEIYFETKTRELEEEPIPDFDTINSLFYQENGKQN